VRFLTISAAFQCENLGMFDTSLSTAYPSKCARLLLTAGLTVCISWIPALAYAEANVLGLPAVPQPKPGSSAPAATAASKPASGSSTAVTPVDRSVLAGEMGLQHSALNGVGRIVYTTKATFATAGTQGTALAAARAVQRDIQLACGKQCKPEKMSTPKIMPNGQLQFELAFSPLHQHLTQSQFLAALQSQPLNLTPAQLAAPSQAPAGVKVNIDQAATSVTQPAASATTPVQ
jgi:hypothetical protein